MNLILYDTEKEMYVTYYGGIIISPQTLTPHARIDMVQDAPPIIFTIERLINEVTAWYLRHMLDNDELYNMQVVPTWESPTMFRQVYDFKSSKSLDRFVDEHCNV